MLRADSDWGFKTHGSGLTDYRKNSVLVYRVTEKRKILESLNKKKADFKKRRKKGAESGGQT